MKVNSCVNGSYLTKNIPKFSSSVNCCSVQKPLPENSNDRFEFDYGKCLKQMSYIFGVSVVGIVGLVMAIKGKLK